MILFTILLLMAAISGIYLQYRIEHIVKNKEAKRKYGKIILTVTMLFLIGNNLTQFSDSRKVSTDLSALRKSSDSLDVKLEKRGLKLNEVAYDLINLQGQYDSLLSVNNVLKAIVSETNIDVKQGFQETHERLSKSKNPVIPRSLSSNQKKSLSNALATNIASITIRYIPGDNESRSYANEFLLVFKKAKWEVKVSATLSPDIPTGLTLIDNDPQSIAEYGTFLLQVFNKTNVPISFLRRKKWPDDVLTLLVGPHP